MNPSREASLEAAIASTNADEVILDLEDAVAPNEKEPARGRVLEYLNSGGNAWVRVNDASSDFWSADCRALADARGLKELYLPRQRAETTCGTPRIVLVARRR